MTAIHNSYDVVVIGAGAGGLSAAITAQHHGLSVLILEKHHKLGGSTAISGGAIWAPLNRQSAAAGHPDQRQAVEQYLHQCVGTAGDAATLSAFLDECSHAVDFLQHEAGVALAARTYSPDYHADLPGAGMGGRTLDPLPFDGRLLGPAFRDLRDPLPEFMVLGGMMVTLTDARHLLNVTRSFASWKHGMKLVLRYCKDRLSGYHRGTRLVLGNALAARLFNAVLERRIPYLLNTPAQHLIRNAQGRVHAVQACINGQARTIEARCGVVLATGGFPWHQALRQAHFPQPSGPYSMAPAENTGDGIEIARALGADWAANGGGPALWAPVSVHTDRHGRVTRYPHLVWDRAKPGLMAVNAQGQRFVNEATSYHEFVRAMYASHRQGAAAIPAFLLCDSRFIEKWGLGLALPGGRARQHLEQDGYLIKAHTLDELAQKLDIAPAALAQSVARFNQLAAAGHDADFGKGSTAYNQYLGDADHHPNPCLGSLDTAPFYAVQVWPGDIGTAKGLRANAKAQVLDAQGAVIEGLWVAGNDMGSCMGGEYPAPGITLGPAITFGYIAGKQLAALKSATSANTTKQV